MGVPEHMTAGWRPSFAARGEARPHVYIRLRLRVNATLEWGGMRGCR